MLHSIGMVVPDPHTQRYRSLHCVHLCLFLGWGDVEGLERFLDAQLAAQPLPAEDISSTLLEVYPLPQQKGNLEHVICLAFLQ
jgi:hypothetical protein